jgi:hypothetical protein
MKVFGEEHSNVAIIIQDIGRIYSDLGDHKVISQKK